MVILVLVAEVAEAPLLLLLNTKASYLVERSHHIVVHILLVHTIGVIAHRVASGDDAALIVIEYVVTEVVVELYVIEFFLSQVLLQGEH